MARTSRPAVSTSSIKRFLDEHPLSILIGLCVSIATATAGVMTYVLKERIEVIELRHKAEISDTAAKAKDELLEVTAALKQTIADLNFRLTSIERRVPGAGATYFDISTVSVGPETIRSLGSKYKPYASGELYVAIPETGGWSFEETNELKFHSEIFGLPYSETTADPRLESFKTKVFLWRTADEVKFRGTKGQLKGPFTFFPSIAVQRVNTDLFRKRAAVVLGMLEEEAGRKSTLENDVKALAKKVDELTRDLRIDGDAVDETRSAENQNSTVATSSESTPPEVDRVKKTDDLLAALENVWSADLSSFVITDIFAQSSIHATLFGAQHRFYSAQKKGNVFYVQDQITFRDVSLIRKNQPEEQVDKITIDAETFFFSSGANGYIIRIFVPAFSGRADAFAWIRSWLAGLQIPLD